MRACPVVTNALITLRAPGMAKVAAEAFRRGLRFRTHMPGECAESEVSYLCDDLHRAGLRRILIDPLVTTTYSHAVKAAIHAAPRLGAYAGLAQIKITDWRDLSSPEAALDWRDARWAVDYGAIECCPIKEGREHVEWGQPNACHRRDIMPDAGGGGNHTADFLRLCAAGCRPGEARAANASAAWAPPRSREDEERLMRRYCAACG